jgi:hypothetical protein
VALAKPDEGDSQPLLDLHSINVDLRGLDDFATLLRGEVDGNLRPYTDEIIREHSDGVAFGARSPSGEVQAARVAYHDCLTQAYEALHSYVHTSEVLLTAAHKVAELYASADQLSTARMQDVDSALAAATTEVQIADAARTAAAAAQVAEEAAHETQRELHRGGR